MCACGRKATSLGKSPFLVAGCVIKPLPKMTRQCMALYVGQLSTVCASEVSPPPQLACAGCARSRMPDQKIEPALYTSFPLQIYFKLCWCLWYFHDMNGKISHDMNWKISHDMKYLQAGLNKMSLPSIHDFEIFMKCLQAFFYTWFQNVYDKISTTTSEITNCKSCRGLVYIVKSKNI